MDGGSRKTIGRYRTWLPIACFYLARLAAPVGAQDAASIIGQVKDESGGVLPGVTVTATGPALQVPAVVSVTDANGEYRLTPLPIGNYQVVYALPGFQSIRREELRLTTGFIAKVDVAMKVGSLEETITVSGSSPIVDVTSTATSTQLTREALEMVPVARVGWIALFAQSPGVRSQLDIGGSTVNDVPAFRAFGQTGEPWQTIEGVLTSTNRAGQSGNYFDYGTIEESQVKTSGANADMPLKGIQVVSLVKSGSNTFRGGGFWSGTDERFQSNNIDSSLRAQGISDPAPLSRSDLSGELGGRIIRDKLWFYQAVSRQYSRAEGLGSQPIRVAGPWGKVGDPSYIDRMSLFYNTKVSYQAGKSNRFIWFDQWQKTDANKNGATQFVTFENRFLQRLSGLIAKAEWEHVHGNSLVANIQTGTWWWHSPSDGFDDQPARLDLVTLMETGFNNQFGSEDPRDRNFHTKGTTTWFRPDLKGTHEFKGGFDFVAQDTSRQRASRAVDPASGFGDVAPYEIIVPGGLQRLPGDYQLQFRSGVADRILLYNFPVKPHTLNHYFGGYVQDNWVIARRFTVNLGLRYAHDNGFVPKQCREQSPQWPTLYPAQCFDKVQYKVWNSLAPRLHVAWDVAGDGKTVIKGGWSRFDHRRLTDPEVLPANRNVQASTTFRWRDLNGNRDYDPGEVNLDPNGADFITTSVGNAVPNLNEREPKADEFTVTAERELIANMAVRVSGIYSLGRDNYALQNNKRPYEVYTIPVTNKDPGPDNVLNTADDTGRSFTYYDYPAALRGLAFEQGMLVNDPRNDQTYKSVEVAVTKRVSHNWQFYGSHAATWKHIPIGAGVPAYTPNVEVNSADDTVEWIGKVSGSYSFPAQIVASLLFESRSGDAYARNVLFSGGGSVPTLQLNVEPIGTRHLPTVNHLDLRLEKRVALGGTRRAALRLNLYNMLNSNTVLAVTTRSGTSFGKPTSILASRLLEFGLTFNF